MSPEDELTIELTRRILGTDGVRGIYPESVAAATVATLINSDRRSAAGLIRLKRDRNAVVVAARIAVDVDTPSALVVAHVLATAQQVLGPADVQLQLEIAHID